MGIPGAGKSDTFSITPEQAQIHEAARPVVRAYVIGCGFDDEADVLETLGLGAA